MIRRFATQWLLVELGQIRRGHLGRPFVWTSALLIIIPTLVWIIGIAPLGIRWQSIGAAITLVVAAALALGVQWGGCALSARRADRLWMLTADAGMAGALASNHQDGWKLGWVWARPTGQGLGSALMVQILNEQDLPLYLDAVDGSAAEFYRRHGFSPSAGRSLAGVPMHRK